MTIVPSRLIQKETIDALSAIAMRASQTIIEIYEHPQHWGVTHKSDRSPLTQADLLSNEIIVSGLAALAPELPVLSEESSWKAGGAISYWAVDPLDGTKEFLKRNGEFTVNIALIVDGIPRLGVVCAPVLKTIWAGLNADLPDHSWAAKSEFRSYSPLSASRLDWSEISVASGSADGAERPLRLLSSRSHNQGDMPNWLCPILNDAITIERGSSLKFCLVAQGDADIYVRNGPTSIWDTAAGHAVVVASGGKVIDIESRCELNYSDPGATLNPSFVAYSPFRLPIDIART